MIPLIILGAIVVVPILLALIFRVNALFIYASVCAGYFLQFSLSDDVDLALATIIQGSNSMVVARFVLLGLPVLLTILFLRKTAGRTLLFQIVPLLFTGLFIAAITLPLLPPGTEQAIYGSVYGGNILGAQDLVIAGAAVSNFLLMVTLYKQKADHKRHH